MTLLSVVSFSWLNDEIPDMPIWPPTYKIKGTWSLPNHNVREPVEIQTDKLHTPYKQLLTEYGIASTIITEGDQAAGLNSTKITVQISPRGEECLVSTTSGGGFTIVDYLPDPTGWEKDGTHVVLGRKCYRYKKMQSHQKPGDSWYDYFYVEADTMLPIRYAIHGLSISGGHPADYVLDIEDYGVSVDKSAFIRPAGCRTSSSFGPKKQLRATPLRDEQDVCRVISELPDVNVPEGDFSWRGRGILPRMLDQASCGSCWAQATAGCLTSQLKLLGIDDEVSVQQVVDCTWDNGTDSHNHACAGGEGFTAFDQLRSNKVDLASSSELPYLGVGGLCTKETKVRKSLGRVIDCIQFKNDDPEQFNQLLKKAIYKYGPLMISFKVNQDEDESFYTLGAPYLYKKDCTPTPEEPVNHGVLVTGWKTFPDDNTYGWEIQNSWSEMWGDHGFGYLDKDNNCGIDSMVLVGLISPPIDDNQ